jgi:hypothetical protein
MRKTGIFETALLLVIAGGLSPAQALARERAVTLPEQQAPVAQTQGAAVGRPPAAETLRGVVDSVDQRNDTITIRLSADTTEQFKVQDGLIFNSVRFGDLVEITVQNTSGTKTIVGLTEK